MAYINKWMCLIHISAAYLLNIIPQHTIIIIIIKYQYAVFWCWGLQINQNAFWHFTCFRLHATNAHQWTFDADEWCFDIWFSYVRCAYRTPDGAINRMQIYLQSAPAAASPASMERAIRGGRCSVNSTQFYVIKCWRMVIPCIQS